MADLNAFENYFQIADLNQDGKIDSSEAIAFFQGCNLPNPILAQIWRHADQEKSGFLGRKEFYNALRLVTIAQTGRKLTQDVVTSALHGPAASKIPPPMIKSQHSVGSSNFSQNKIEKKSCAIATKNVTWPKFSQLDVNKYAEIFQQADKYEDGKITGEQARTLFLRWKIPIDVLKKIWFLSDQDWDGNLSLKEFCIALYLMERYRDGFCLPDLLPDSILRDETLLESTTSVDPDASGRPVIPFPSSDEESDDAILALAIKASIESARNEKFPGFTRNEKSDDAILALHQNYAAPSAPPIESLSSSFISAPSVDSFTSQTEEIREEGNNVNISLGMCSICIEDPVEGACIPCGHMAGCMGCLQKIKESGGECPICRSKIDRVVKLYAVWGI